MAHGTSAAGGPPPPDTFIVRILRPDGGIAGLGTLVGERRIVTCAHVVNAALGLEPRAQARPEHPVSVDFPRAALDMAPLTATVVAWVPPPKPGAAGDDVAGLLLTSDPPVAAAPAALGVEPARPGQALRVFGYLPDGDGVSVPVTVRDRVGGGRLRLDLAHLGQPGFTGSPLFDDALGRVLGIVAAPPATRTDARDLDSFAIDADRLRLAWPEALSARWQRRPVRTRTELTILHVSDTQFGKHHLFGGNGQIPAEEEDALLTRLRQDLARLADEDELRPDLLVVTGDLAESGLRSEFARAARFLAGLAEAAEVPRKHVAIVPGNHDVNRLACLAYFADTEASEQQPVPPYFAKWRDYVALFEDFYADVPGMTFTPDEPWTLFEMPDLHVVVAGLNSTMADSHLNADHYGWVGEGQLRWFAQRLEAYRDAGWLRLAAVHHNVTGGAALDEENLRDTGDLDRFLGSRQVVNLVLHGHPHDATPHRPWSLWSGVPTLSAGSAAVGPDTRHAEAPNHYQLITVSRDSVTQRTRRYAAGGRRWTAVTRDPVERACRLTHTHAALRPQDSAQPADVFHTPATANDDQSAPEPAAPRVRLSPATRTAVADRLSVPGRLSIPGWRLQSALQPPGWEDVDSFLSRVAEATQARFPRAFLSERSRGDCDYLRISCPMDNGAMETWPVGVIDGPATEADVATFVEHVHGQFAAADSQVRSELVYAGPAAPAALIARARRQGVRLRSFVDYQGLLDLGPLAERQRERLAADPAYPEQLYVEQRFRMADGSEVKNGLIEQAVDWLCSDQARLIVVLGDFGRGKTSFLRQLTRRLPAELPGLQPILVELRTLEKAPTLDELLGQHLIKQGVDDISPAKLRYMIRSGRIALLFDGFDELELRVGYDNAADYLQTLLDSVTDRAKVILTSRTQHFRSTQQVKTALGARVETRSGSRVVVLEDFTEDQIRTFLTNLYDRDEVRARARFSLITDIQNLLELAHNPRMLTFVAAMDEEQLRGIPRREGKITQAGLYQAIIDSWLEGEAKRQDHGPGLRSFDKNERLAACTELALRLWASTNPTIPLSELAAGVSAALTDLAERGYSPEQATHSIASGSLLVRTEDGAFSFIHQSIMEWLVAAAAARDLTSGILARHRMSRLTVDFLIDLAGRSAVERWITDVLNDSGAPLAAVDNALTIDGRLTSGRFMAGRILAGVDLRTQDLSGANLRNARLRGANLRGMVLGETNFSNADLSEADFTSVRMTGGTLRGATLSGSRWERAAILGTDFASVPELEAAAIAVRDPAEVVIRPSFSPGNAAFSPGGDLLAITSSGAVEIVDANDKSVIRVLRGHSETVTAVAFSPDGTLIATASEDDTARTWTTASGISHTCFSGHGDTVTAVAFSPDGTQLATASDDVTARIWDTATGTRQHTLFGHIGPVTTVAFSPGGGAVATASWDGTARVWDAATGALLTIFAGHQARVYAVAFSPDGTQLATASTDETARIWDAATGAHRTTLTGHDGIVTAVAFSPDGAQVATASGDGTARIWDAATGTHRITLTGHNGLVRSVAFSPDGTQVVTASDDRTARIWDAGTGIRLTTLTGHGSILNAVAFSPDGALIATASTDRTAHTWDIATGTQRTSFIGHKSYIYAVAFSPDGRLLATASADGSARTWDAASGAQLAMLRGHQKRVRAVAFSPDGSLIATASNDNTARTWNSTSGAADTWFTGHDDIVTAVAFSPDGMLLATGSTDNTARTWDTTSGSIVATLTGHEDWVRAVVFSPDGTVIATASNDNTARIWDSSTGSHIATLSGHDSAVTAVVFSPDGTLIATASADNTSRLWESATGTHLATLVSLPDGGYVTLLPDGRYKLDGDPINHVWWAIKLCRFETGELDPYVSDIKRLPLEARILPTT